LAEEPPRLVSAAWDQGQLTLILDRPVTEPWIQALHNMESYGSVMGKPPFSFSFGGKQATVSVQEHEVQEVIDHFRSWLPVATRTLKPPLRAHGGVARVVPIPAAAPQSAIAALNANAPVYTKASFQSNGARGRPHFAACAPLLEADSSRVGVRWHPARDHRGMSRAPRVSGPDLIAALANAGFHVLRVKGSHHFLRHPDGRSTVVPAHTGETIGPGLLHSLVRRICGSVAATLAT
jgi:predicted RNA binding protein YcfA (HicA-like mRNA interferase family)